MNNQQTTATGPLATSELKEAAVIAIDRYLEHSGHVNTMEGVQNFIGNMNENELDNLFDAEQFLNDLITYFLVPENCTMFSKNFAHDEYSLSELLPRLRYLFTELNNSTSRATIRRDWLIRFAGAAKENTVASIVKLYTDETIKYQSVRRA